MHSLQLFLTVFAIIFVAELPDKTALTALVLATKYRPLPVFLGTALALTVQSGVAVLAGRLLSLLPGRPVHIGAGVVFLVSAVIMWFRKEPAADEAAPIGEPRSSFGTFGAVFGVVFLAEWGDLSQLATAAFVAREHAPWTVFFASTFALWAVTGIAVVVGRHTAKFLSPHTTKRVAAVLFAAIGVVLLMPGVL